MRSTRASEQVKMEEEAKSYEEERIANIKQNAALLESLGLNSVPAVRPPQPKPEAKAALSAEEKRAKREALLKAAASKRKRQLAPTRRSNRVASREAGAARQQDASERKPQRQLFFTMEESFGTRGKPLPKPRTPIIPSGPEYETKGPWTRAPRPSRDESGRLVFEGRWKGIFTPNVTPEEMFAGGAFAGAFFCDTYSKVLRRPLSSKEDIDELPFSIPDADLLLRNPDPDGQVNRFKVRAGQSLQEWEKAGWIWSEDPRGWAQWYTRFWDGRRCEDDERQVRRWLKVAGPTGRFKRALLKKVQFYLDEYGAVEDEDVGRVLRQCLWQWAHELTPAEYKRSMETD
ncbi:hypothetical protein DB88DRAFT_493186 [Papiliotrema laurentii]|uniref:Uncharacterized protein n=1 Tax=Papiliotrema laurentii TaxID=5418 RepID=A0AAD9FPL7_PAPLA|nr:hypothetical protein DB88DRAFT_493186 [Papiliotrema laurentii]